MSDEPKPPWMVRRRAYDGGVVAIVIRTRVLSHAVDFEIYEVSAVEVSTNRDCFKPRGDVARALAPIMFVHDVERAKPWLTGYVKWDGCMNLIPEGGGFHFCEASDVKAFGELLTELHLLALLCPNVDKFLAGYERA